MCSVTANETTQCDTTTMSKNTTCKEWWAPISDILRAKVHQRHHFRNYYAGLGV